MTKRHQRSETLVVEFQEGREVFCAVGVVLECSERELLLGHNFSGTTPIDTTTIKRDAIYREEIIAADEMRSAEYLSDLE